MPLLSPNPGDATAYRIDVNIDVAHLEWHFSGIDVLVSRSVAYRASSVIKRWDVRLRPSVCLSRRSTAAASAGEFAAEVGRRPASDIDQWARDKSWRRRCMPYREM